MDLCLRGVACSSWAQKPHRLSASATSKVVPARHYRPVSSVCTPPFATCVALAGTGVKKTAWHSFPRKKRRAGGEMSSWHKLRAFSLTSRCKPRLEDKGPCFSPGAPRPVGHASILSKIFGAKKIANKGQSGAHPCATPPAALSSPCKPSPGRRAPRDRASSAAAVHANWLPSTTRRRARCRGTAATATRTTSTQIPSRSRSHKWQP